MAGQRTVISIGLDDSEVRRKLAALGNDAKKISAQAVQGALPQFPQIPQEIAGSGAALGEVFGRAQAQLTRAIMSGVPGFQPGQANDPNVVKAVGAALKQAFDPYFSRLSISEQEVFTKTRGLRAGNETQLLRRAEQATGDAAAVLTAAQTASGLAALTTAATQTTKTTTQRQQQVNQASQSYADTLREAAEASSRLARTQTAADQVVADAARIQQQRAQQQLRDEEKSPAEIAADRLNAERIERQVRGEYRQQITDKDIEEIAFGRLREEELQRRIQRSYLDQMTDVDRADEANISARNIANEEEIQRLTQRELAQDRRFIAARAERIASEEAIVRQTQLILARGFSSFDAGEQGELEVLRARNRRAIEAEVLAQTTDADLSNQARINLQRRRNEDIIATQEAQEIATNTQFLQARAQRLAAEQRVATATQLEVTRQRTPEDIQAEGQLRAAQERQRNQVQLAALEAQTAQDIALQGRIAAARRASSIQLQTAEFRELAQNKEFQRARAERIIAERQYILEQRRMNAQVAREMGFGGRGLFSRLLARFGGGGGGIDGDSGGRYAGGIPPSFGEFFGSRARTVLGYAVPSALLYGAVSGITSTIREAEELERVFAAIESQFDEAFGSGADEKFSQFKRNILEIARETGVAGEDIANISFQLQGAFGSGVEIEGRSGQALVLSQARAAAEIARVTGLSSTEINDSLTAASLAFEVSFRRIGDVTLNLQDRFGVLAKEIIPFLGDIAPVARDAGFTLEEFATIAAVVQQRSGRSGAALAEAFGRVLPALSQSRVELLELAATNENLGEDFVRAIAGGDIKTILFEIAENFTSLSRASQEFVVNLIGGRREAQAILPAFNDSQALIDAIEETNAAGGELERRFEKIQETLTQSLARLSENIRQLGVSIYESGLGEALETLVDALSSFVTIFAGAFEMLSTLNEFLDGWPGKILAAAAAWKILSSAMRGIGTRLPFGPGASPAGTAASVGLDALLSAYDLGVPASDAKGAGRLGRFRGFARGLVTPALGTIATASVVGLQQAISGVNASIEQAKADYAEMTMEELQKQLRNTKDPFSGGFISDFGAAFKRGVAGRDADPRNLIQDEINRRRFQESGREDIFREALADKKTIDFLAKGLADQQKERLRQIVEGFVGGDDGVNAVERIAVEKLYNEILAGLSDPEYLQTLIDKAATDPFYNTILNFLQGINQGDNPINEIIQRIRRRNKETQNSIDKAQVATDSSISLDALRAQFENGTASMYQYLQGLDRHIANLEIAAEAARAAGDTDSQWIQELNEAQKKRRDIYSSGAQELADFRNEMIELRLGDTDAARKEQVNVLLQLLDDPNFIDLDARLEAARDIISLLQGMDEAMNIDPVVQEVLAAAYFDPNINYDFGLLLETWKIVFGSVNETILRDTLTAILLGNQTADEIRSEIAQAKQRLLAQQNAINSVMDPESLGPVGNPLASLLELEQTYNRILEGAPKIPSRTLGKKSSANDAKKKADELREAYDDLARAQVEGDPVRLAQLNIQILDRIIASAETEAERVRAQADRIRAVRRLDEALEEIGDAWASFAEAWYDYQGNSVAAAEALLFNAQHHRDRIVALFEAGDGSVGAIDRINAETELLRARARLRDTQLSEQLEEYQFLYDMGRITRQQFIQYLETLKQIPDLTQDQIRDLDRQIRQLSQELQSDLQFNLPDRLRLPTLYEVRRINQAGSSTAGFVDNRQVNITIHVNNGTSEQQMLQVLQDTIGAPSRIGASARRY